MPKNLVLDSIEITTYLSLRFFISHQTEELTVASNSKVILCRKDGSASILQFGEEMPIVNLL
jgi:hypothetical protein